MAPPFLAAQDPPVLCRALWGGQHPARRALSLQHPRRAPPAPPGKPSAGGRPRARGEGPSAGDEVGLCPLCSGECSGGLPRAPSPGAGAGGGVWGHPHRSPFPQAASARRCCPRTPPAAARMTPTPAWSIRPGCPAPSASSASAPPRCSSTPAPVGSEGSGLGAPPGPTAPAGCGGDPGDAAERAPSGGSQRRGREEGRCWDPRGGAQGAEAALVGLLGTPMGASCLPQHQGGSWGGSAVQTPPGEAPARRGEGRL